MGAVHTYDTLVNKYGNFRVPAAKIKIAGKEVFPGGGLGITDLSVILSAGASGSVSFTVGGAYDRGTHGFKSSVKESFGMGKTVEVELGYLSATTLLFKGFIASVNMDFSAAPTLSVTAMDVSRLMMQSGNQAKYFKEKKHSEIAAAVMSPYSHLCTLEQQATTEELQEAFYQSCNDYQFMTEELGKILNREFLVVGDKAYFRQPKSVATAMITLKYGYSLLSFRRKEDYLKCQIVAVRHDRTQGTTVVESETVTANQTTQSGTQIPKEMLVSENAVSDAQLKALVKDAARKKKDKAQTASGSCVGLPEIVPGRFIDLTDLDSAANGKYYVTQVSHSFGSGGFFTNFEVEGFE